MNSPRTSISVVLKIGVGLASGALILGAIWYVGNTSSRPPDLVFPETAKEEIAARPASVVEDEARPRRRRPTLPQRYCPATRIALRAPDNTASPASTTAVRPPSHPADRRGSAGISPAAMPADGQQPSTDAAADDGNPTINSALLAQAIAGGTIRIAQAEEVTETGDARLTKEAALVAATKKTTNPNSPNVETRDALDRLIGAFTTETGAEAKQDFLAVGEEVASSAGTSLHTLLALALQPQQPLEVQKQALYLATDREPDLVKEVAANPKHPLQLEAEAFLLQARIAEGVPTSITDAPAAPED